MLFNTLSEGSEPLVSQFSQTLPGALSVGKHDPDQSKPTNQDSFPSGRKWHTPARSLAAEKGRIPTVPKESPPFWPVSGAFFALRSRVLPAEVDPLLPQGGTAVPAGMSPLPTQGLIV